MKNMSREIRKRPPPPWEAVLLVAHHLDPKTLAMASCVSKSWSHATSSDHLWQPFCSSTFPSLSNLKGQGGDGGVSYRRLYAIALTASKRRLKPPPKPRLSLDNLIFAIELSTPNAPAAFSTILQSAPKTDNQVFNFDIDENRLVAGCFAAEEMIKITWHVVLKGWGAVFTMMGCQGKLSTCTVGVGGAAVEGWFSEELPSPGCCSSDVGSGIVADVKLGFRGNGNGLMKLENVNVGMLRCGDWRYVSIHDGLRYLQHFLLPHHHV